MTTLEYCLNIALSSSLSTQKFADRAVRNKVEESLNGHLDKMPNLSDDFGNQPRCEISLAQKQTVRYRYMFEKISERAESELETMSCNELIF
jgi:predicted oxidoreductase